MVSDLESERPGFVSQQCLLKSYVTLSKSFNLLKVQFLHVGNTDLTATIRSSIGVMKVKDEAQY